MEMLKHQQGGNDTVCLRNSKQFCRVCQKHGSLEREGSGDWSITPRPEFTTGVFLGRAKMFLKK